MNRLRGQIAYLCGPMDRVEDRGVEWRLDIKKFLWNELEAGVFSPTDKPIEWGVEDEESRQWRKNSMLTAKHLFDRGLIYESNKMCESIMEHMKPICASDLRLIDQAGFVIMYIDTDVHMCGSFAEQTWACLQHKPVVICCKQGKFSVPDWLWGVCRPEMFFSTWDEVKNYLRHVAFDDNVEHYRRWKFIDMNKVYGKK